ncbi:MAG: ACP S-malonyltransferase [Legionellaceae bacterium]|nr:ACP S-malonyltransferase [Legionellaceae bacterium]
MHNHLAVVFPGQGSQFVGMLDGIIPRYSRSQKLLAEASEVVGYEVSKLIAEGPEETLHQTEYTQVAMLVSDVIFFRFLQEKNNWHIRAMAGHSLGEYAALVCADVLSFSDAVHLVSRRGQLMQNTVPAGEGAMAAIIGLGDAEVEVLCRQSSHDDLQVSAANYNSPGQIVIAGHRQAVQSAIIAAEKAGARMAKLIPVSVPCHCPLLETAASYFRDELDKVSLRAPAYPVLSNIDAMPYGDSEDIRKRLVQQLYRPVQWVKTIEKLVDCGVDHIIECGPGKTLTGLIKRINREIRVESATQLVDI